MRHLAPETLLRLGWALFVLFAQGFLAADSWGAEQVPQAAYQWKRTLRREVIAYWGYTQPAATFAAQIHQESRWRPNAKSPYAAGLGQQTPTTVKWLGDLHPAELGHGSALDPVWSMRALVVYDKMRWDANKFAASPEHRWAFGLADYNGGSGNVAKERRLAQAAGADAGRWFCSVEHFRARSQQAFNENRDYPIKILWRWRQLYLDW